MLAVGITPLSSNRVRMNQTSTPKYTETRPSKNTPCHHQNRTTPNCTWNFTSIGTFYVATTTTMYPGSLNGPETQNPGIIWIETSFVYGVRFFLPGVGGVLVSVEDRQ